MSKEAEQKSINPIVKLEEEVLRFWDKAKIFEQSVEREAPKGDHVFYDGPPFATGLPHYGHIVASLMKDVVPRYFTMRGFRVERKWGWDCHGLPIENIAEKELGFKRKQDIIEYGVDRFNEFCRSKVLSYVEDWKIIIRRLGRWADMENDYKTMDLPFMESVWWVFKQLWDKGLIYESYRSIHICPRCETTLSQQEVTEGYKEGIKDLSAVVKFELVDEPGTFVLAWTTTPWTLIGNTALAVNLEEDYLKLMLIEKKSEKINLDVGQKIIFMDKIHIQQKILGEELTHMALMENPAQIINEEHGLYEAVIDKEGNVWGYLIIKGKDLVGKKYKPLFEKFIQEFKNYRSDGGLVDPENFGKEIKSEMAALNSNNKSKEITFGESEVEKFENAFKVYDANFVSTEEGTGIVHIAPAYGEDDLNLGKEHNLPFIQHVKMDGMFINSVYSTFQDADTDPSEWHVKPIDDVQATDKKIVDWLDKNNKLFNSEQYEHNYPHCWRCETPLLNYVTTSWFVKVLDLKPAMLKNAEEINWSPAHIKEGRWGKWLEGARDWSISRQRFWASVMPLWKCEQCGELKVFGSVKELEEASGKTVADLHKHVVDKITVLCKKCQGTMRRIPDVLDAWFDSGSMPYAQMHYPFENKEKFEANFPAEFIAEGTDQTRAWFYYLHVLATAVSSKPAFKNVIVNGIVQAEDGRKMSKRLNNYTDPAVILDQYGADAIRYYLLSSSVMAADDLNFSDQGVVEALRKNLMVLWNVYKFYEMYAAGGEVKSQKSKVKSDNVLDKWILARLNQLIAEVTKQMEGYDLPRSVRPISDFINDFSTWYLRRSRERFKSDDEKDKQVALATTQYVLLELSKVMAPFMPFIAEQIWQKVTGNNFQNENQSVHLEVWPLITVKNSNEELKILEIMSTTRQIVELGLAERDKAGIKIRQQLNEVRVTRDEPPAEYLKLIRDELNVKKVTCTYGDSDIKVELDTELTEELKLDGIRRELVRSINNLRKNAGLTIADRVAIYWSIGEADFAAPLAKQVFEKFSEEIKKDTLADSIEHKHNQDAPHTKEVNINGEIVWLGITKA